MQRQSIGSPIRVHAVAGKVAPIAPEAEDIKPEKPIRPSYTKERSVHLIPLLTLFCLLVLYLSSHDPSTAGLIPLFIYYIWHFLTIFSISFFLLVKFWSFPHRCIEHWWYLAFYHVSVTSLSYCYTIIIWFFWFISDSSLFFYWTSDNWNGAVWRWSNWCDRKPPWIEGGSEASNPKTRIR
jgi:hypothetical protein